MHNIKCKESCSLLYGTELLLAFWYFIIFIVSKRNIISFLRTRHNSYNESWWQKSLSLHVPVGYSCPLWSLCQSKMPMYINWAVCFLVAEFQKLFIYSECKSFVSYVIAVTVFFLTSACLFILWRMSSAEQKCATSMKSKLKNIFHVLEIHCLTVVPVTDQEILKSPTVIVDLSNFFSTQGDFVSCISKFHFLIRNN